MPTAKSTELQQLLFENLYYQQAKDDGLRLSRFGVVQLISQPLFAIRKKFDMVSLFMLFCFVQANQYLSAASSRIDTSQIRKVFQLAQYNEAFKQAEIAASYYWSNGYAQTEFLTQIIIDILGKSYNEIETLAHTYKFEIKLNKTDSIENTIYKLPEIFRKNDLRKNHPTVSNATNDRTLARLRDEGKIRPLGKGRSSRWQQLIERKELNRVKQLSLFEEEF